jgi:penicillin-binding protein 2
MKTGLKSFSLLTLIALLTSPVLPVAKALTTTTAQSGKKKTSASSSKKTKETRVSTSTTAATPHKKSTKTRTVTHARHTALRRSTHTSHRASYYLTPTFADSTWGDSVDGEDLAVRRAAVEALGPYNGSIVVVDPTTGRILTMVNQKTALTGSFQPCSTIKLVAAIGGLNEGLIERSTMVRVSRRESMNLTTALARSNNQFFTNIGQQLGFDRISTYSKMFGLGERAGWNIDGESAGVFPSQQPQGIPVGMMMSYGMNIELTPLQLAAIISSIANGGTLYYLQYPRTIEEAQAFEPRVKRTLEIQQWLPEIRPGMMGAVAFGSARRAGFDPDEPIMGKTGTCSDGRTHLGWFGSYNEIGSRKLVVVVLLTGGSHVSGPVASGVAGKVYKNLSEHQYFSQTTADVANSLVSTQACCTR